MGCNYLSIPKLQRLHRWRLGMDKRFHPTHYNGYIYLSMLGFKLIHVSKRGYWYALAELSYNDSCRCPAILSPLSHDDVIKWKHFPRYWPFVRGIHRWPVNSPHKGQWRGAFNVFFDLCLSKQSRRLWFETSSRSLWRHCNEVRATHWKISAVKRIGLTCTLWWNIYINGYMWLGVSCPYSHKLGWRPWYQFVWVGITLIDRKCS